MSGGRSYQGAATSPSLPAPHTYYPLSVPVTGPRHATTAALAAVPRHDAQGQKLLHV